MKKKKKKKFFKIGRSISIHFKPIFYAWPWACVGHWSIEMNRRMLAFFSETQPKMSVHFKWLNASRECKLNGGNTYGLASRIVIMVLRYLQMKLIWKKVCSKPHGVFRKLRKFGNALLRIGKVKYLLIPHVCTRILSCAYVLLNVQTPLNGAYPSISIPPSSLAADQSQKETRKRRRT